MNEQWKPIRGYEGLYEVSDLGRIRGLISGRIITPYRNDGYLRVDLFKNNKKKVHRLHRVVLETFEGDPPSGYQCRHLNHDKEDCRLENLEWNTQQVNIQDNLERGACNAPRGEEHHSTKLTWEKVNELRRLSSEGWNTLQLAKKYSLSYTACANIVKGKTWKGQRSGK